MSLKFYETRPNYRRFAALVNYNYEGRLIKINSNAIICLKSKYVYFKAYNRIKEVKHGSGNKKILFAPDLSKNSRHAFNYAVSAADRYGATITILHVMEETSPSANRHLKSFVGEESWQELQKSHEQEARKILIGKQKEGAMIREALHEFCEQVQKDFTQCEIITDEIIVTKGNVVTEILAETQARGIDLIVMGYHSRGKLEEAVVGSTTRRVLRQSKIPVLLVRLPMTNSDISKA